MSNDLTQAKSVLACLLAEEQLIVEQRNNVSTAFFDSKSRLLVLPTLKDDLSTDVVDLFISHECAHALFTPETWSDIAKEHEVNRSILNVLEDARIEKKVKHRYPGLRSIYSKAYKNLTEIDFFGLESMNFDKINLIDKINLFFKIGYIPQVTFDEKESEFVKRTENLETYDEVVELGKEIQQYMKDQYQKQKEEGLNDEEWDDDFSLQDGFSLDFDTEESESFDDEQDSDMEGFRSETKNGVESEGDFDDEEFSNQLSEAEKLERALDSLTSEHAERKIKELFTENEKQSVYVNLPKINLNETIIPFEKIYPRLRQEIGTSCYDKNAYNLFKKNNAASISYLIKEFQLKKNAEGRKKIKVSKTGDINFNKLFSYKISDDIFKKAEIVPKNQSHGLVFFLDWSSSMENCIHDTIKQLLSMLLFCKKMNIPFDVYAFTNQYVKHNEDFYSKIRKLDGAKNNTNTLLLDVVNLMNIFSSRMPNNVFIEACNYLLSYQHESFAPTKIKSRWDWNPNAAICPSWFSLGATPLNHSIFLSKKVVEDFQLRTKVQKVNCIFLTDGESHSVQYNYELSSGYVSSVCLTDYRMTAYVRDMETKVSHKIKITDCQMSETNGCVEFLKKNSNFKVFGFRLTDKRDFKQCFRSFFKYDDDYNEKNKIFTKNNCVKSTKSSFDEFYIVKMNTMNEKDEVLEQIGNKDTQAVIAKKFQKALGARVNHKVFLQKFIEFIS